MFTEVLNGDVQPSAGGGLCVCSISGLYINKHNYLLMGDVIFNIKSFDAQVRHCGNTKIEMSRDTYSRLTCGTFLGTYADTIITNLHLIKATSMPNDTSFKMKLIGNFEQMTFEKKNKDILLSKFFKTSRIIEMTLEYLDVDDGDNESDYTDNVTPISEPNRLRSRFPQQTSKTPHLELLHRLDRLLDNCKHD